MPRWSISKTKNMRSPNKDEIYEILILQHTDRITFTDAIEIVYGREAEPAEVALVDKAISKMRDGWVAMNIRTRNIRLNYYKN